MCIRNEQMFPCHCFCCANVPLGVCVPCTLDSIDDGLIRLLPLHFHTASQRQMLCINLCLCDSLLYIIRMYLNAYLGRHTIPTRLKIYRCECGRVCVCAQRTYSVLNFSDVSHTLAPPYSIRHAIVGNWNKNRCECCMLRVWVLGVNEMRATWDMCCDDYFSI